MSVYIKGTKESDDRVRINFIHYKPLDENGNIKPELQGGYLVDSIPQKPEPKKGIRHQLYYNPQTGDLWYEEEEIYIPKTPEEKINEKVDLLIQMMLEKEGII